MYTLLVSTVSVLVYVYQWLVI